jgi:hypothetical protein
MVAASKLYCRIRDEQNSAIAACIRWRNHNAEPMTSFTAGSPVRSWTSCFTRAA